MDRRSPPPRSNKKKKTDEASTGRQPNISKSARFIKRYQSRDITQPIKIISFEDIVIQSPSIDSSSDPKEGGSAEFNYGDSRISSSVSNVQLQSETDSKTPQAFENPKTLSNRLSGDTMDYDDAFGTNSIHSVKRKQNPFALDFATVESLRGLVKGVPISDVNQKNSNKNLESGSSTSNASLRPSGHSLNKGREDRESFSGNNGTKDLFKNLFASPKLNNETDNPGFKTVFPFVFGPTIKNCAPNFRSDNNHAVSQTTSFDGLKTTETQGGSRQVSEIDKNINMQKDTENCTSTSFQDKKTQSKEDTNKIQPLDTKVLNSNYDVFKTPFQEFSFSSGKNVENQFSNNSTKLFSQPFVNLSPQNEIYPTKVAYLNKIEPSAETGSRLDDSSRNSLLRTNTFSQMEKDANGINKEYISLNKKSKVSFEETVGESKANGINKEYISLNKRSKVGFDETFAESDTSSESSVGNDCNPTAAIQWKSQETVLSEGRLDTSSESSVGNDCDCSTEAIQSRSQAMVLGEDGLDAFSVFINCQLRQLPFESALFCQNNIVQTVINEGLKVVRQQISLAETSCRDGVNPSHSTEAIQSRSEVESVLCEEGLHAFSVFIVSLLRQLPPESVFYCQAKLVETVINERLKVTRQNSDG